MTEKLMTPSRRRNAITVSVGLLLAPVLGVTMLAWPRAEAEPSIPGAAVVISSVAWLGAPDAARITGPGTMNTGCGNCHKPAFAAWELTPHHKSLKLLTEERKDQAKEIADAMGIRSGRITRSQNLCWDCHTTPMVVEGQTRPEFGVSCESCHGPAAGWLAIHNDRSHSDRWKVCDEKGMIRKDRIDLIAENCFSCHTVANEELVNKGKHKAGSEFELVAWSQGAVRHNFFENEASNRVNPPERLRVMFVAGKLVELEVTLRNLASVKEPQGEYARAMLERCNRVSKELDNLRQLPAAEIGEAYAAIPLDEAGALSMDSARLAEAAAKVKDATRRFVQSHDGSKLSDLDPTLPKPESYKGTAHQP
jgi:hypothetical protein